MSARRPRAGLVYKKRARAIPGSPRHADNMMHRAIARGYEVGASRCKRDALYVASGCRRSERGQRVWRHVLRL